MATKERYGPYVLQYEESRTGIGSFFRAVQLGPSGYERHVKLFRSRPLEVEAVRALAEGLKGGLEVQDARVAVRGFDAGSIGSTAFAAYELIEGRSVGAMIARSEAERHPFAHDQALLIVSRAAAALEAAHRRRQTHGLLIPDFVRVSHDGEVKVFGFGIPTRLLRDANLMDAREAAFLAPEVAGDLSLDIRADIFSLGAQLFEMVTGSPLPHGEPIARSLASATVRSHDGDRQPIPKALTPLLRQALAESPELRFNDATVFRKAVDTLLYSGEYSPTTFNLAFFMHTLFRDEGDGDTAQITAERDADYRLEMATAAAPSPAVTPASRPEPDLIPVKAADAVPLEARTEPGRSGRVAAPLPGIQTAWIPAVEMSAEPSPSKRRFPIASVLVGLVAVIGTSAYLFARSGAGPREEQAMAPAERATDPAGAVRLNEVTAPAAAINAEPAITEQIVPEEARTPLEAEAKPRSKMAVPAARAQAEAKKEAQAGVGAEPQKAEQAIRKEDQAPAPQPAAIPDVPASQPAVEALQVPAPPPASAGPPPPADPSVPAVVAPRLLSAGRLDYPPLARSHRIAGVVVVSALVDEQGNVIEAKILRGVDASSGLDRAALDNVRRRKYSPAILNGKPGRAWITVEIGFKLGAP